MIFKPERHILVCGSLIRGINAQRLAVSAERGSIQRVKFGWEPPSCRREAVGQSSAVVVTDKMVVAIGMAPSNSDRTLRVSFWCTGSAMYPFLKILGPSSMGVCAYGTFIHDTTL